jgi:hypothetical protein
MTAHAAEQVVLILVEVGHATMVFGGEVDERMTAVTVGAFTEPARALGQEGNALTVGALAVGGARPAGRPATVWPALSILAERRAGIVRGHCGVGIGVDRHACVGLQRWPFFRTASIGRTRIGDARNDRAGSATWRCAATCRTKDGD